MNIEGKEILSGYSILNNMDGNYMQESLCNTIGKVLFGDFPSSNPIEAKDQDNSPY
jgi:hypothetical protein